MITLQAFHNDPKIKAKYIRRVRAHRKADQLIKGIGWENGKGCAVGCTLRAYEHDRYPTELGIPEVLARLEDAIFEGLPNVEAQGWPERFLSAIKPGADLAQVWSRFVLWLLEDQLGVYATSAPVAALYRRQLIGETIARDEWAAAAAHTAAAAADAYAAAAYAADAAYAAAYATAAAYAAAATYAAAAAAVVRSKFWLAAANKLIELLKGAK